MEDHQLKQEILEMMDQHRIGTLATVQNNKPHSRFMTFMHEGFTLYSPASKAAHKTEDIEAIPFVHILLGYDGQGYEDAYLEIEAKAEIIEDDEKKQQLWHEELGRYLSGPNDSNYALLCCKPERIRYMRNGEVQGTLEGQAL